MLRLLLWFYQIVFEYQQQQWDNHNWSRAEQIDGEKRIFYSSPFFHCLIEQNYLLDQFDWHLIESTLYSQGYIVIEVFQIRPGFLNQLQLMSNQVDRCVSRKRNATCRVREITKLTSALSMIPIWLLDNFFANFDAHASPPQPAPTINNL